MRGLWCACAAAGLMAATGCGGGDPFNKQPISGTVTVKGQPLAYGQIFFEPAAGQKFATNATITDGKFALTKETGLSPGKYKYRLQALDKDAPPSDPTNTMDPSLLPKGKAGKPSVVLAEKDKNGEVDVKAGAENKLDINIP